MFDKNRPLFLNPYRLIQLIICIVLLSMALSACSSDSTDDVPTPSATVLPTSTETASIAEPTPTETVSDNRDSYLGDAADVAVKAAQKYAGTTLIVSYEAGLQALDGYFFGPEWTRLTGIEIEVVEYGFQELYLQTLATPGEIDVINIVPAWQGDFVTAGILEPLNDYIDQYYPEEELADIHPTYLNNWVGAGETVYGIPDDGDVHILYYRRDLFEDPENIDEFKDQYDYDLQAPQTWAQWNDICAFFTAKYAPALYGCAIQHTGQVYNWFQSIYRSQGGEFFDPETMKAQVNNEIGVQTANIILASLDQQPPGARNWAFLDNFGAWMDGSLAMTISWPPVGRWSEGYGRQTEQLNWLPETQVAGKVGYAQQPGGGELAVGFMLGVSSQSENKEAAYLFVQWLTSQEISLQRTMTPFALRDPYRLSHYQSALYKAQWTAASEYLTALRQGAETGYLNLMIPGAWEYEVAAEEAMVAFVKGADVQETLEQLAAKWDAITDAHGVEAQKEAYLAWRSLPNAYPDIRSSE